MQSLVGPCGKIEPRKQGGLSLWQRGASSDQERGLDWHQCGAKIQMIQAKHFMKSRVWINLYKMNVSFGAE